MFVWYCFVFFLYIYNLQFFKQKVYSHQVLIYLWDPSQKAITKKTDLRNRQIRNRRFLRRCLIHIAITILRNILYIVYLCSCLGLGLSVSYMCDLFFIFSFIFIAIYHITSFKQTYLILVRFIEYLLLFLDYNVDEES